MEDVFWQQHWDRKANPTEQKWISEMNLLLPDRICNGLIFDPLERKEKQVPHPFSQKGGKQWTGCYLWYVELGDLERERMSLYVGRSAHLYIRMNQHWRGKSFWMNKFWDDWWSGKFDFEIPNLWVAIWYKTGVDAMRNYEHRLIAYAKPRYNRQ